MPLAAIYNVQGVDFWLQHMAAAPHATAEQGRNT